MEQQPPRPPLDYSDGRFPPPPPDPQRRRQLYVTALVTGSLVSLVVWPAVAHSQGSWALYAILALPLIKLIAGVVFAVMPEWRTLGAGILTSIGVGFLIFFGTCWIVIAHA